MDTKALYKEYIAPTYNRFDLSAVSGKGATIYDEDGKKYIDLGSGIACNIFGVGDEAWKAAVTGQLDKLQHISNLYYTQPQARLAQLICEKTGMSSVFFSNSGAEANECAIKCARKYSHDNYGGGRSTIVTLVDSFHGRTMATLSATGQESMHVDFSPFLGGFVHVPAGDIRAMEQSFSKDNVCAVMLELIQGEGGVNVLDKEYVKKVFEICRERDILVIVDEVQTGNGRTGSLYAHMGYGVRPDIFTTAKGLGGGLPIGACVFGEKSAATLTAGTHGSTFGGNPVCCAGAVSILERIDDKLLDGVREKGKFIRKSLKNSTGVTGITGLGLMLGLSVEKPARDVVAQCLDRGVIFLTAHEKVRLLPPLNIGLDELDEALTILKGVLS